MTPGVHLEYNLVAEARNSAFEVAEELAGSLVYLDSVFAETARDAWGIRQLMGLGAVNVCSLENSTSQDIERAAILSDGPLEKVVVFTGRMLHECRLEILRLLTSSPAIRFCTIFTTVSEETHASLAPQDLRLYPFETFREDLNDRVGSMSKEGHQCNISVKSCPLPFHPISSRVFTIPSSPEVREKVREATNIFRSPFYKDMDSVLKNGLEEDVPEGLLYIARSLAEMCGNLSWKVNIFAQGVVSKVVAGEMASLLMENRTNKRPEANVSVVFIDRSLDLVTPLCHTDTLMDKMLHCSSNEPGRQQESLRTFGNGLAMEELGGGCLAQPSDNQALKWFELICSSATRDAALRIRKELKQSLLEKRVPSAISSKLGSISVSEIIDLKRELEGCGEVKPCESAALLQFVDTISCGMDEELTHAWDAMLTIERAILHLSLNKPETVAQCLCEVMQKLSQDGEDVPSLLSVEDASRLTAAAYLLTSMKAGHPTGFAGQEQAVTDAFAGLLSRRGTDEGPAMERAASLLGRLKEAASVTCSLNRQMRVPPPGPNPFNPLLCQIVGALGSNGDSPSDPTFVPGTIGGILASGLGHFGLSQRKPKVGDSEMVVLFVLGGISPLEIKLVKETVSKLVPDRNVLLGATHVVGANDMHRDLFRK
mmetsp:Transcript_4399/g.11405  ORF Transcript_4399/g.11405 Transcript_4399/m.11405 type:complete len:655 (-) Transcript_4399:28-1992(-)